MSCTIAKRVLGNCVKLSEISALDKPARQKNRNAIRWAKLLKSLNGTWAIDKARPTEEKRIKKEERIAT